MFTWQRSVLVNFCTNPINVLLTSSAAAMSLLNRIGFYEFLTFSVWYFASILNKGVIFFRRCMFIYYNSSRQCSGTVPKQTLISRSFNLCSMSAETHTAGDHVNNEWLVRELACLSSYRVLVTTWCEWNQN